MEGRNPSSQYQAYLTLDILKQLYKAIEGSLKEAANNNLSLQEKPALESQFVFNRLKDNMQILKSELGMVTMRELLGDAMITQNFKNQLQNFKVEIASDFQQKMNLMKETLQKMQQQITDQKKMIISKGKENKELKEQIEALEKLLEKQSEYFQEQIAESNQSIQQKIDKVIEEAQRALDDPDGEESKQPSKQPDKSESAQAKKPQEMITQEEKPIISNDNFKKILQKKAFKVSNQYDLKTFKVPYLVAKADNGNIFTGGQDNQLTIFNKDKIDIVPVGGSIWGGVIYKNDLYLFLYQKIQIIDTTTFKVKNTILVKDAICKAIRVEPNSMICFQSDGYIDIISLELNTVTHSYQISSKGNIYDAVQGDTINEYALATIKGLIFIDIADGKFTEKDHYLDGNMIQAIRRYSNQHYVLHRLNLKSVSSNLIIFDRSQSQRIKEINTTIINSIEYVTGVDIGEEVRFMVIKDKEGIKVLDLLDDYSLTNIADVEYNYIIQCKSSMFQEIDKQGNLKIFAFEWNDNGEKTGKSTKLKEISIDLH